MRFTYEYLVFQPRIKHVHQIASCCRVVEYASSAVSHDAGAHMVYRQTTGEKSHRILFTSYGILYLSSRMLPWLRVLLSFGVMLFNMPI